MPAVRSDLILKQLARKHTGKVTGPDDVFLAEVKNGRTQEALPGHLLKVDALAIRKSWAHQAIIAYEIKVARSDFLKDTKWPRYLDLCNEFYFVCPNGLINEEELTSEVGLIWYNPEKDCITTRRKAVWRKVDIPKDMLLYIIMTRCNSDSRHPFFSSEREMWEAWIQDKAEKNTLGKTVRSKAAILIRDLQREVESLKRQLEGKEYEIQHEGEQLKRLREIAVASGATEWQARNYLAKHFEAIVKSGITADMHKLICEIAAKASNLRQLIQGE